jgi:hypothetical protein
MNTSAKTLESFDVRMFQKKFANMILKKSGVDKPPKQAIYVLFGST